MRKLGPSFILLIIVLLLILSSSLTLAENENIDTDIIERGKVLSIERTILKPNEEYPFPGQILKIEITSGEFKGQVVESYNIYSDNPRYDIEVEPGQKVILSVEEENGQLISANLTDVARDQPLLILAILFMIVLVILGGKKGVKSLLSLAFTIFVVFKILLPFILRGFNPMLITIILSAIVTAVTLLLVGGISRKTFAAILGVIGGATCAGLLAYIFGHAASLTGLGSHEAQMLGYVREYKLDLQGILFASMLVGALGAVMDVGMSIASAIEEVYQANPISTPKELFASGMNVGRDIMGTMANTLILAYTGGSLPLLLILVGYQPAFLKVINLDLIASEIIRALAGSLGLFIAIPLTAIFSTWLIYQETVNRYYT